MQRLFLILLTLFSLLLGGSPKAGQPTGEPSAPHAETRYTVRDVVDALKSAGLDASDTGQSLDGEEFGAAATVVRVQGEAMQVYVYAGKAEQEAVKISPDGSSVEHDGTISMLSWVAPPHFVRKGNLLITFATRDEELAARVVTAIGQLE